MKLSSEQEAVVAAHDRLVLVNAFAGAGKTSTIMEYIKARKKSRILTLVFNHSASQDMQDKAKKHNIKGKDFSTIHAFAYKNVRAIRPDLIQRLTDKILPGDLANRFGTKLVADKKRRFIAAKTLGTLFTDFCKSNKNTIKEYINEGFNKKIDETISRLNLHSGRIIDCLLEMENDLQSDTNNFPITHDGYLKWWQVYCNTKDLGYDEILVDEAQDTTNCALALVLGQKNSKYRFIGDRYQQIYAWNGCVNSFPKLEKMGATSLALTQSFRCPDRIAVLARPYLALLGASLRFRGCDVECPDDGKKAILCRTNAAVINTLYHLKENKVPSETICLYGGVKSYNFSDIFDIANLASGKKDKIQSAEVKAFGTFQDFKEYVEEIDDFKNKKNCELVSRFGPSGIFHLRGFLQKEPYSDTPVQNGIIVSTAHKSKGSEFGTVELATDFFTISDLLSSKEKELMIPFEDLRILYVAITRAKASFSPFSRERYALKPEILQKLYEMLQQNSIKTHDVGEKGETVDTTSTTIQGIENYALS